MENNKNSKKEITRNRPRTVLNGQARQFVSRLRNYFENESLNGGPLLPVSQVVNRVSDALGISRVTVCRITREEYGKDGMEENVLKTPPRTRSRKPTVLRDKYDANAIKNHIHKLLNSNPGNVTSKVLLKSLKNERLFKGGRTSLFWLLGQLGFAFVSKDKKRILVEEAEFVACKAEEPKRSSLLAGSSWSPTPEEMYIGLDMLKQEPVDGV